MKMYSVNHPQKGLVHYKDSKRSLWMISMFFPFVLPLLGLLLFNQLQTEWVLGVPLLIAYIGVPLLDWIVGEDKNNPPEEIVSDRLCYSDIITVQYIFQKSFKYVINIGTNE